MIELCLGTAQFGLDYGIANDLGKVDYKSVCQILAFAQEHNLQYLDTAQAYGNAQEVLGNALDPTNSFHIISKLPSQTADPWEMDITDRWELDFQRSLSHLAKSSIDALLLHRSSDLLRSDSHLLITWMQSLIDRQLVKRIGVSIYEASDLDGLPIEFLHIIQLPLSIYDQRLLLDGTIQLLHSLGKRVHIRSVFLQGLVLSSPKKWPSFQSAAFREHHQRWWETLKHNGRDPLTTALGFIRKIDGLEALLVGVDSFLQFKEIITAWNSPMCLDNQMIGSEWAWNCPENLDPRTWPQQ